VTNMHFVPGSRCLHLPLASVESKAKPSASSLNPKSSASSLNPKPLLINPLLRLQALVRMATVEQAAWSVQNLHMTTPPDGVQPILVRFADTSDDKVNHPDPVPPAI
jgi:hypothetical protein